MIHPQSQVHRNPDVPSTAIDGEIVMMSPDQSEYFGLNRTASHLWRLLDEVRSVEDLYREMQERFDVSADRCREEVDRFLSETAACGLISIRG